MMGVSCDSCLKGNFRGKRYKCLICYDYDLCATCYEAGATTTRHTTEHPMQCILTRSDFELYYGGESLSVEQPQSFTCPFCGKMGFTESTLQEHVTSEHSDTSFEVVCPICAALPGGDPNLVTDDFAAHLTLEHRSPRDLDEPSSSRHVRRIPHPGRGVGGTRARRSNMHFGSSGGLSSLSPSNRESMDPIAELLSQLSGVRRTATASQSSTSTQLQQLQMQLQLERQQLSTDHLNGQAQVARQQLERLPRRQTQSTNNPQGNLATSGAISSQQSTGGIGVGSGSGGSDSGSINSQFLLSRCTEASLSETELQALEVERADRSLFVQELLLNTLAGNLNLDVVESALIEQPQQQQQKPQEVPPSSDDGGGGGGSGGSGSGRVGSQQQRDATNSSPRASPQRGTNDLGSTSAGSSSTSADGSGGATAGGGSNTSNNSTDTSKSGLQPQSENQQQFSMTTTKKVIGGNSTGGSNSHPQQQQRQGPIRVSPLVAPTGSGGNNSSGNRGNSSGGNMAATTNSAAPLPPPSHNTASTATRPVVGRGTGTIREVPTTPPPNNTGGGSSSNRAQPPPRSSAGRDSSSASSPSSTRRKLQRSVDGRNQSNEPPPPH